MFLFPSNNNKTISLNAPRCPPLPPTPGRPRWRRRHGRCRRRGCLGGRPVIGQPIRRESKDKKEMGSKKSSGTLEPPGVCSLFPISESGSGRSFWLFGALEPRPARGPPCTETQGPWIQPAEGPGPRSSGPSQIEQPIPSGDVVASGALLGRWLGLCTLCRKADGVWCRTSLAATPLAQPPGPHTARTTARTGRGGLRG